MKGMTFICNHSWDLQFITDSFYKEPFSSEVRGLSSGNAINFSLIPIPLVLVWEQHLSNIMIFPLISFFPTFLSLLSLVLWHKCRCMFFLLFYFIIIRCTFEFFIHSNLIIEWEDFKEEWHLNLRITKITHGKELCYLCQKLITDMENLKKKCVGGRRNGCFLNSNAFCCPHTKPVFNTILGVWLSMIWMHQEHQGIRKWEQMEGVLVSLPCAHEKSWRICFGFTGWLLWPPLSARWGL